MFLAIQCEEVFRIMIHWQHILWEDLCKHDLQAQTRTPPSSEIRAKALRVVKWASPPGPRLGLSHLLSSISCLGA